MVVAVIVDWKERKTGSRTCVQQDYVRPESGEDVGKETFRPVGETGVPGVLGGGVAFSTAMLGTMLIGLGWADWKLSAEDSG